MANFKLTDEREYFKPFNYPWAYEAWLKHEQSHWLHTEVPMAEDVKDWQRKLSIEEKGFLTNIFRFFTQGDIDVAGGYVDNYLPYFKQTRSPHDVVGFLCTRSTTRGGILALDRNSGHARVDIQ